MNTVRNMVGSTRRRRKIVVTLSILLVVWLAAAYLLIPFAWDTYARRHPSFDDNPRITTTSDGHPGDPLNVALLGSKSQITALMEAARWYPSAALGLESDLKIAADTVLSRSDDEAPVSSLYLFGRKEDLAFEQPVGDSPRKRHHVRFWKTNQVDRAGNSIWIGSASYDERVGFSHTTGEITHHIAADVDAERNHLFQCIESTGNVAKVYVVDGFHHQLEGRNGGGDLWHTDGKLYVALIAGAAP